MGREILRYRLVAVILIGVIIFGLLVSLFGERAKTADYISVDAKLIETRKCYGTSFTNDMSLYQKHIFSFTVNGQEYIAERESFRFSPWKEGSIHSIRCNPNNPEELEDTKKKYTTIAVLVILLIAFTTLVKSTFFVYK